MKLIRKVNIGNPDELKKFKLEIQGVALAYGTPYGFPYRQDTLTEKGANYTIFCPLRWMHSFTPDKLRHILKQEVDADRIEVEYIDFINK